MKIAKIIWLDAIIEKLAWKHHVQPTEIIEVLNDVPKFRFVEKGHRAGEDVYAALGRTKAGRYLIGFFIYRNDHSIVVLSARDMTDAERKRYDRK